MRKRILMSSVAACLLAGGPAWAAEDAVDQGGAVTVEPIPEVMEVPAEIADDPALAVESGNVEETPAAPPAETSPAAKANDPASPESETAARDWAPEDLNDKTVFDLEDNEVGTIREVVVDVEGGTKLIVEYGGFLGFLTKEVEVPIELFRPEADGRVMVNLTEDKLDAMHAAVRHETTPGRDS